MFTQPLSLLLLEFAFVPPSPVITHTYLLLFELWIRFYSSFWFSWNYYKIVWKKGGTKKEKIMCVTIKSIWQLKWLNILTLFFCLLHVGLSTLALCITSPDATHIFLLRFFSAIQYTINIHHKLNEFIGCVYFIVFAFCTLNQSVYWIDCNLIVFIYLAPLNWEKANVSNLNVHVSICSWILKFDSFLVKHISF